MNTALKERDITRQISGAAYLAPNNLNLDAVNPQLGAKFSPNLYEFLNARRNKATLRLQRLFLDNSNIQWLGYFDDVGHFVGARLSHVLSQGRKANVTCPVNLGEMREVEDFWTAYLEKGRCAIDPAHTTAFLGERWKHRADGRERSCLWCHCVTQQKVAREVTVVKESWV